MRALYTGDCLDIMNEHIAEQSVDLIYLDPPFNSNSHYNLPFKSKDKSLRPAEAFNDTWEWTVQDADNLRRLEKNPLARSLATVVRFAQEVEQTGTRKSKSSLAAYLINMILRLRAMRRVLKTTGSIYLHCDPTAEHYLKLVMDAIFGRKNFRNEIIWKRTTGKGAPTARKTFGNGTDTILFYSNSNSYSFNMPKVMPDKAPDFPHIDENGSYRAVTPLLGDKLIGDSYFEWRGHNPVNGWRISKEKLENLHVRGLIHYNSAGKPYRKQYEHEYKGIDATNLWADIPIARGKERLGYPTQKPLALLERIIKASSNPGDLVLDTFCGCGTTVHAAESLNRQWIGIDISPFSAGLIRERIRHNFQYLKPDDIYMWGAPATVEEARQLASDKPFEFEKWVCGAIGANGMYKNPGERGADGGVDGVMEIDIIRNGKIHEEYVIIQVKGGNVTPDSVKALSETVRRLEAVAGVMVCFDRQMTTVENQRSREIWSDDYESYPVIQGYSIEDLLQAKPLKLPPRYGKRRGARMSS